MPRGDQLARQWKVLHVLAAPGGRTIAELAADVGGSRRTVWRDLAAYCYRHREVRTFAVERFRTARPTEDRFEPPAGFNLDKALREDIRREWLAALRGVRGRPEAPSPASRPRRPPALKKWPGPLPA